MSDWNSAQYLRFQKERTQPAIDLANRLRGSSPRRIADIGCGPGNSTAVLRSAFPDAAIVGIDSSPNMIEKARNSHPELEFQLCDATALDPGYDLLFSNACLQWIPAHDKLLPELMQKLNDGGTLAVQIPANGEEPLFQIIREVAADPKWDFENVYFETNEALSGEDYFNILTDCASEFQIWETVYYHSMPSHQSLLEWVKGSRLRPYLEVLDEESGAAFEQEILSRAIRRYPIMKNGGVLLRFRRLFFTATR